MSESHKVICPFHEDVNPSMIMNFKEGNWFCFGCGMSGRTLDFIRHFERNNGSNLNDLRLQKRYVEILKSGKASNVAIKKPKEVKSNKQLYDEAYDFYHGLKSVDWHSDIQEEVEYTRLYMRDRGFTGGTLNKCKAKITYSQNYPIIFPMFDNGKFKGWVCRTTSKEVEKKRKYLYNKGFSRSSTLVGDYGSKKWVIVVEGYMDRLKVIQFGYKNVIAILGWKATLNQIEKLKEAGVVHIISALDNDEYGRKGTEYLKGFFKVTRFKYLKGIKDPGDMSLDLFKKMMNETVKNYKKKESENNGIS